ncbi:hypothetical protein PR202_gb00304 [Eleusine coracana subsp. coracana]|uniref:non-specific serine/threonine protein kinase n=1 Tax=Eleusine coracana subsp. coracana TaxID=191504 RepID=A0AAV5DTD6_ELECO|nr:hypothetical protein PR202_gb00304 [Eleusine coracana subsp. coracana]
MDPEASSTESNDHMILYEAHASLLERMLNYERIEPTDLPLALLAKITNYFSDDLRIGHGGFAVVYKGRLGRGKMVAVKKLSEKIDMDETKYNQEVDCLMRVKHRNIVRFLGYCANTHVKRSEYQGKFVMADVRHRLLCFEYLNDIKNIQSTVLFSYVAFVDASCGLDWAKRYEIIKGICEGLSYLHEKRIVHLDLKPENILLNDDMVPKISDFGLSRCFDEDQTRAMASKLLGTTGYMAPEFYDKVITAKSDIYSLGVIFTEILTGQKGYSTQNNVSKINLPKTST